MGPDNEHHDAAREPPDDGQVFEICLLAEQIHRLFLDLIQSRLSALDAPGVNAIRALMLVRMGDAEMTASEILWRGCYVGSNANYNMQKLIDGGYVGRRGGDHDKRQTMVRITAKGAAIRTALIGMNADLFGGLDGGTVTAERLIACAQTLRSMHAMLGHAKGAKGLAPFAAPRREVA